MGLFDRDKKKKEEKPDFSNVESGSSSTAPEARETDERIYEVQEGDSLWKIAERFYGDGTKGSKIHEANRERIDDPDVIQPGWKLTIPEVDDDGEGESR